MSSLIPVGFRFSPTEEELITHYLRRKIKGEPLPCEGVVLERDIYGKSPWDVFLKNDPWHSFKITKDKWEHVIYVFTKLKKIGGSKKRISRTAGCGTWDGQTGIDTIHNQQKHHIGFKRMLAFQVDNSEYGLIMPARGHWIMHEYSLGGLSLDGLQLQDHDDEYVLCKIKRDDSKCLRRAPKYKNHRGAVDDDHLGYTTTATTLDETRRQVSKTENPTRKKMRYEASSTTPQNFDVCVQDQSVTLGHQFLLTQQRMCSSPNNISFDAPTTANQLLSMQEYHCLYEQSVTMGHMLVPTQESPCSSANNISVDATTTWNEPLSMQEYHCLYDQSDLFAKNIDPELEARLNVISELLMADDEPLLSVSIMDQIQENLLLF